MSEPLLKRGAPDQARLSESPRDLLRNLLPADWDGTNWPLSPEQTARVNGCVLYFWLGAGTINQRRDVAQKMGRWEQARAEVRRHQQLGAHAVYLDALDEREKRREARSALGVAVMDGLRLRYGAPLVQPMLGHLQARNIPKHERHVLDAASDHRLAYDFMCALWQDVSDGAPLPAGVTVCPICTVVFEPARKKVTPGHSPRYCPRCGEHREREERKRALIPRLAKGGSVPIRGPVGSDEARRRATEVGVQPNWNSSMVVSRCLECGDCFARPQPKQWCSDAHEARWRRRHP